MRCFGVFRNEDGRVEMEDAEQDVCEGSQTERELGQGVQSDHQNGDAVDGRRCSGSLGEIFGYLSVSAISRRVRLAS